LVTVLVAVSAGEVTVLVAVSGGGVTVAGVVTTAVVDAGGAMGTSPPQPAGRRSSAGTVMIVAANLEILMTTPLMMGGARGAVADGAGPVTDPAQGKTRGWRIRCVVGAILPDRHSPGDAGDGSRRWPDPA